MRLDRFTERAQEAVLEAQEQARNRKDSQIEPEHLLLGLLEQREGVVPQIVRRLGLAFQREEVPERVTV